MLLIRLVQAIVLIVVFGTAYCGVSGLSRFLRSKYKHSWNIVDNNRYEDIDHVCIDMNQILHTCVRVSDDPAHITAKIFSELNKIMKVVKPKSSLVLAFDGPAPFAKMMTQRKRRNSRPETSQITPGTSFMETSECLMICYILQRVKRPDFKDVTVYISDATIPGEGELKIINWIRRCVLNVDDSVLICGTDSDIILQAMTLQEYTHISVLQSSSDYPDAICSIPSLFKQIQDELLPHNLTVERNEGSVSKTLNTVMAETSDDSPIAPPHHIPCSPSEEPLSSPTAKMDSPSLSRSSSFAWDLTVLFALSGNDYIPKLRGTTMTRTLACYSKAMERLPPEDRFLVSFVENPHLSPPQPLSSPALHTGPPFPSTAADRGIAQLHARGMAVLMEEITKDLSPSLSVPLPFQVPSPASTLSNLLQKRNILKFDFGSEANGSYKSVREAKNAISTAVLKEQYPDKFRRMIRIQQYNKRQLVELLRSVQAEKKSQMGGESLGSVSVPDLSEASPPPVLRGLEELVREDVEKGDGNTINVESYSKYVKDSDVVEYLRGLAWLVQMYSTGLCPDVEYAMTDRTPPSSLILQDYLLKHIKDNEASERDKDDTGDFSLDSCLRSPWSNARYFSAEATAVCLIPLHFNCVDTIPAHLRQIWRRVQNDPILKLGKVDFDEETEELDGSSENAPEEVASIPLSKTLSCDDIRSQLLQIWGDGEPTDKIAESSNRIAGSTVNVETTNFLRRPYLSPNLKRNMKADVSMSSQSQGVEGKTSYERPAGRQPESSHMMSRSVDPESIWVSENALGTWTVITSLTDEQLESSFIAENMDPSDRNGKNDVRRGNTNGVSNVKPTGYNILWKNKFIEFPLKHIPRRISCPSALPKHIRILELRLEADAGR